MFGLRSLLRPTNQMIKNVVQPRNMSVISVPPKSKVSKGEIIALATLMVIGWSAVPAWVLVNIKHYRDKN